MDGGKSFRFQIEDEPEVLSFLCWARALELDADGLDGDAAFKSSRRRSRKVFVRALETFLPQSFELLITAVTIILRLNFENTQKAITLLGNFCSENIPWQSQIVSANHLFPPSVWRENDRIRARRNSDQAATEKEAMKR